MNLRYFYLCKICIFFYKKRGGKYERLKKFCLGSCFKGDALDTIHTLHQTHLILPLGSYLYAISSDISVVAITNVLLLISPFTI